MKAWPAMAALCLASGGAVAALAQDDAEIEAAAKDAQAALEAATEAVEAATEAAEESALPTTVPQSFTDCAARFRRTSAPEGSQRRSFDCTRQYYDSLNPVSTYEFAVAGNRADAVADLYVDELVPAIAERLAERSDNEGWAQSRQRLLSGFVRAARDANEARCAVIGDIWSGGTIRVAFYSACAIENSDRLIDDLLDIEENLLPR